MAEYNDNELLMLSGIQHFMFCRRQWALIHLEQQWQENVRTIEGAIVHKKCHDVDIRESRGNLLIVRGLPVHSHNLGVSGECDVVEFHKRKDNKGAVLATHSDTWDILPVEYKRGKPKSGLEDISQLCLQALCLEEMFSVKVNTGCLYYASIRRRQHVVFNEVLKSKIKAALLEMHEMYKKKSTPTVKATAKCKNCSLKDICLPKLQKNITVAAYYTAFLGEDL